MRKIAIIAALALVLCGAFSLSAQATATLDFNCSPATAGSISFGGPGTALVGTDIQVDSITGIGTPLNDGVTLIITDGVLNFNTGIFTGLGEGEYDFAAGGSITLTGTTDHGSGLLLSGTFVSSPSVPHVVIGTGGGTVVGNFTDEKNLDLITFFGLSPADGYAFIGGKINLAFSTASAINPETATAFSSQDVLSGDITNIASPIPIPPSMVLLGSGLLGLVGFGIRRKQG